MEYASDHPNHLNLTLQWIIKGSPIVTSAESMNRGISEVASLQHRRDLMTGSGTDPEILLTPAKKHVTNIEISKRPTSSFEVLKQWGLDLQDQPEKLPRHIEI